MKEVTFFVYSAKIKGKGALLKINGYEGINVILFSICIGCSNR